MTPPPPVRRAYRPADRRIISGVSAGVADHLGVDPLWVRLGFTIAAVFNGAGIVAYLLLWRFLPISAAPGVPGLDAATRRGLRTSGGTSTVDVARAAAVLAIGAGVALLVQVSGRGIGWSLLLPMLIAAVGLAVVWRGLDDTRTGWLRNDGTWPSVLRVVAGSALIGAAGIYLVTAERGWAAIADVATVLAVAVLGITLIVGPWVASLIGDLGSERRERIRSQERADVAAHLHDSVLQTLALLQKNAADPAVVATLARRQERDLRAWLYGDERRDGDSVAAALRAVVGEVEVDHRVPVEIVVVGDAPLDDDLAALVRAAREAVVNAAKHAHADRVDVYAEVLEGSVEIFVRDRGIGFDPDAVPEDRMGIRGSVVGRVERHGGTVVVRSAPGEGTEVRLRLPRSAVREDSTP